jgi:hypothetical protein
MGRKTELLILAAWIVWIGCGKQDIPNQTQDNGATNPWIAMNVGLPSTPQVYSLVLAGDDLLAGTDDGVYISSDGGEHWRASNTGLQGISIRSLVVTGPIVLAGSEYRGVFRTTDGGTTWVAINSGIPIVGGTTSAPRYMPVSSFAVVGSRVYFGVPVVLISSHVRTYQVYSSDITDSSWAPSDSGITGCQVGGFAVQNQTLFAATRFGIYYWRYGTPRWLETSLTGQSVKVLAQYGQLMIAGTAENGVYLSTDGFSWQPVDSGLAREGAHYATVTSVAITDQALFAGTFYGIYALWDNTSSWKKVSGLIPSTTQYSLILKGSNLFAATSTGVWKWRLPNSRE